MKKSDAAARRKRPPSGIERWKWGQGLEHLNGLMRPEITHYVVKITIELADILGIELHEGK